MPAGPTIHYGDHDFKYGQLRFARVHIYPSVAAMNAEAAYAVARLVYVQENQTYYIGKPGAWVELGTGGGGGGGGGGSVPDPADLDHQYPDVVGSILAVDVVNSRFTLDFNPGDLDHLQAGDALVVSGSEDSGAVNWLDGSYDILAVNPGTGVVDVVPGSIPAIPNPPEVTFGNYNAVDQTFPSDGQLAVVNPDPDTGEPAIWIYDAADSAWYNANSLDDRQLWRDGSRTATGWISLGALLTNLPPNLQNLVTRNYVEARINGYSTGRHGISTVVSGANTVVTFPTTDSAAVGAAVGKQLVVAGTSTALDGSHAITAASWLANVATITIANVGVNVVSPPGTVAIYVPDAEFATAAGLAVQAAALAAHVAAANPHPVYTTDAEATALAAAEVTTHNNSPTAHPDRITAGQATTIADAAVTAHDSDPAAHGGALAAVGAAVKGGSIAQGQLVTDTDYGVPLYLDPVFQMWRKVTGAIRPQGYVHQPSTVRTGIYDSIAIDMVVPDTIEVPPAVASRFKVGRAYDFPDLVSNQGPYLVTAVDESTGELTVLPATTISAESISSSVDEILPDGQVAIHGMIELPNGNDISPVYTITEAQPSARRIRLDADGLQLSALKAGSVLELTGTTGNNGTYPIESIDVDTRDVILKPAASKNVFSENVDSIVVSTRSIVFDVGSDVTVLLPGDRLVLATTTNNDGSYEVESVDGPTRTVVVADPLPGTNQAAPAGTGTGYAINRASPLTNLFPAEVTYLTGSIQSIDVDNGAGRAVITFDAGDDLSTILAGDEVEITGATDPLNNVNGYTVFAANNGTKELTLTTILPGADQAAPAGTGVVTGFHPGTDGSAVVQNPSSTNFPFGTNIGDDFYVNPAISAGLDTTERRHRLGTLVSADFFRLDVAEQPAPSPQLFSAAGDIISQRRMVVLADAGGGPFTLDLPPGVEGDELVAQETNGVNTVTLDADGAETIEGAGTVVVTTGTARRYVFRGTNWLRLLA